MARLFLKNQRSIGHLSNTYRTSNDNRAIGLTIHRTPIDHETTADRTSIETLLTFDRRSIKTRLSMYRNSIEHLSSVAILAQLLVRMFNHRFAC